MRFSFLRLLLDAAGGEGNGNGGDADKGKADDKGGAGGADASRGYEAALAKHGNDAAAMARTIYADNERLRAERDEARGKVPAEGAVVLTKADAGRWAELGKLGTVDEIKSKLEAGDAAAAGVAKFEREKLIGQAAAAVGYDAEVLASLAGPDLRVEVKEETKAGKKVRVAEVVATAKDDKGADVESRVPLDKYAADTWPKFLPSLKSGPSTSAPPRVGGSPGRTAPPQPPARPGAGDAVAPPPRRRLSL